MLPPPTTRGDGALVWTATYQGPIGALNKAVDVAATADLGGPLISIAPVVRALGLLAMLLAGLVSNAAALQKPVPLPLLESSP